MEVVNVGQLVRDNEGKVARVTSCMERDEAGDLRVNLDYGHSAASAYVSSLSDPYPVRRGDRVTGNAKLREEARADQSDTWKRRALDVVHEVWCVGPVGFDSGYIRFSTMDGLHGSWLELVPCGTPLGKVETAPSQVFASSSGTHLEGCGAGVVALGSGVAAVPFRSVAVDRAAAAEVAKAFALSDCNGCLGSGLNVVGHPCELCVLRSKSWLEASEAWKACFEKSERHRVEDCKQWERERDEFAEINKQAGVDIATWRKRATALSNEVASLKDSRHGEFAHRDEIARAERERDAVVAEKKDVLEERDRAIQQRDVAYRLEERARNNGNEGWAALALERDHVDRLKLALAQALPPRPPASVLEKVVTRARVEGRAALAALGWGWQWLMGRAQWVLCEWRWTPLVLPLLGFFMIVATLTGTAERQVRHVLGLPDVPAAVAPYLESPVQVVRPASTPVDHHGNTTTIIKGAWLAWSSESDRERDQRPDESIACVGTIALGMAVPGGMLMFPHTDESTVCPRCGRACYGSRITAWDGERYVLDGCVACMTRDLGRIQRLEPVSDGGIRFGTYAVKAGTVFVVDGPVEGIVFVSSGDASIMVERGK